MKTQSMTGFGKGESVGDNFTLSVEIKSVNHRFKDLRFKMGSVFNAKEIELKKQIEGKFARGSFDIFINYKKNQAKKADVEIDLDKVGEYLAKISSVASKQGVDIAVNPTEFMRSDFYLEDDDKEEELLGLLPEAFNTALTQLEASRVEEGLKLVEKLIDHKSRYEEHYVTVKGLRGTYQDQVKQKLQDRFLKDGQDLKIDEQRFMQEVIYYLEKLDIDEEINRIEIHLEKLAKLYGNGGEIGRQIDFLMQELNRETNTIGSKSGTGEISENVVQMKVQLEKIREQALNLQ